MKVLGIYDGHNTSVAYVDNGQIIFSASEERFSRIKLHDGRFDGLPWRSLEETLRQIKGGKPDLVAIALMPPAKLFALVIKDIVSQRNWRWFLFWLGRWNKFGPLEYIACLVYNYFRQIRILYMLWRHGLLSVKRQWFNHHEAHASAAYYTSGQQSATVCSLDGKGDGLCGAVYLGTGGDLIKIKEISKYHSIGYFYSIITVGLGFKKMRHEGKITGLAAYGDCQTSIYQIFEKMFTYGKQGFCFNFSEKLFQPPYPDFMDYKSVWEKIVPFLPVDFKREDVAFAVQKLTEELCSRFVSQAVEETQEPFVALTGGVFANVKVNQRVLELLNVSGVYICPAMGDEGLAAGAALRAWAKRQKEEGRQVKIFKVDNVYFGPSYTEEAIKDALEKRDIKYVRYDEVELEIARLLHQGKVVARFNGRMEWGPRALGNRSILYQPTDKTVNDWLNKRLKRTEFMPFAPATLIEYQDQCYRPVGDSDGQRKEYEMDYMTLTVECTDWMKEHCPAVVHVDGTARPQMIRRETNPSYYKILDEYCKLSGLPTIINTSFNMHEEPIVCSPDDAIRSFLSGHLDYLAIGNFIASYNDQKAKNH